MSLSAEQKRALSSRVRYAKELGLGDLYRREPIFIEGQSDADQRSASASPDPTRSGKNAGKTPAVITASATDKNAALQVIRAEIGECTRCRLHEKRTNIVFGVGNVDATIMFVGEGPGADEDKQGEPFVGRAGQLLNNMIAAMGIRREDVYIANVVKCRPPENRTPEKDECDTCSPFLMQQIEVIRPQMIVALGAVAAKNLLGVNDTMGNMRGRVYDYRDTRLVVTYHPAYLLRDPRQKAEAWKDLQMVMKELGMALPKKSSS